MVELYGVPIGELVRHGVEDYELVYEESWTAAYDAVPLSLSLPLAPRQHRGRAVAHFIDNLLPDNPEVRQRWATDVGLDTAEPFGLLEAYGEDVAGAAAFRAPSAPSRNSRSAVSDDEVAARIALLRSDETAWHENATPALGQFSLGGAQRKFSLARDPRGWAETPGAEPSTHIFKPQVKGYVDGELVEYVVMRTAQLLGIPSAPVELFDHAGEHSLVVERFDRRVHEGRLIRVHQEDVLQALGLPRLRKYESDGGPGVDAVTSLLAEHADPHSRVRYAVALVFAWMVISTDAHAKNYSLFLDPEGAVLTPLYDVSSLIPYVGSTPDLDVPSLLERMASRRLAQRYGATSVVGDIGRVELGRIAAGCGLSLDELLTLTVAYLAALPQMVADVASSLPPHLQTNVIARLVEWMPIRARQAAAALRIDGAFG
jgi:serine/threonine-protein kinase HipA